MSRRKRRGSGWDGTETANPHNLNKLIRDIEGAVDGRPHASARQVMSTVKSPVTPRQLLASLNAHRERLGKTPKDIAEATGVGLVYVRDWCAATSVPRARNLVRYAHALGYGTHHEPGDAADTQPVEPDVRTVIMSIAQAAPGEAEPLSRVLEKIDTPWKPEEIVTALFAEKERLGLDDAALAERSLVTKSTLARWSEGRVRRPRAGAFLKMAVGLDLLNAEDLPKWRTAGAERRRRALVHRSRSAEQGAAEAQEPATKPADDPSRSEELTALSNRVAHLEARAAARSEEFAILAHRVAHLEARAAASTEEVADLTRHLGHLGARVDQHVDESDRKLNEFTEALVRSLTDKLGSHVLSNSKRLDALKESQDRNTQILESHGELLHKLTLRLIEFDHRPPSQHAWEDTLGTAVDIVLEVLKAKSEKGEE